MQSQTSTSLYSHKFWFQCSHPERKCSLYSVVWIIVKHKRAFCKSLCSICDKCSDPRRWWRAGAPSYRAPVKFMQASKLPSTVKKEKCLLSDNILTLHSDLQTPAQTFTYTSMFKCKTHFLNNSTKSAAGFQLHEVPHPPSFNIHHHISLSSYSNRRIPIWILARRGVRGCQLRVSAYTGTNAHAESLWWRKCITVHIYIFTDRWSVLCARSTMCVKTASSLFSEALLRNYPASGLAAVKTMGWWWGWFTVVGRFETDFDPAAKRLSASHGLEKENWRRLFFTSF